MAAMQSSSPIARAADTPPQGARLVTVNLDSAEERDMLRAQRVICGWHEDMVESWRARMAAGERTFYWITIPENDVTSGLAMVQRDEGGVYAVGHISLDRVDQPCPPTPVDLSLASGDGGVMTITSLFVLPGFSSRGLGAFAMDECERIASGMPGCRAVTIMTISDRYLRGGIPGPDGTVPKVDLSPWYARRGYITYKEEVRHYTYLPDGARIGWYEMFMRKVLGETTA